MFLRNNSAVSLITALTDVPNRKCETHETAATKTKTKKTLDELEGFITTAESGSGDAKDGALTDATHSLKRLGGMKRSYNLEIKLMGDAASKVRKPFDEMLSVFFLGGDRRAGEGGT